MRHYKYVIVLLIAILFSCSNLRAQNQSFRDGISDKQAGRYREAINYFEISKVKDSSPENIRRCNQEIKKCRELISLSKPRPVPKPLPNPIPNPPPQPIINSKVIFADHVKVRKIERYGETDVMHPIPVEEDDWKYRIEKLDSVDWIKAERKDILTEDGEKIYYLEISCLPNESYSERLAKIRVTSNKKNDYFEVKQEGLIPNTPGGTKKDLITMSFNIKKKGERKVINLPKSTKVIIPQINDWCEQTNYKYKEGNFLLKLAGNIIKILGGSPELEPCGDNEIVIDVKPNTGKARHDKFLVEGKPVVIEIHQDGN